MTLPIFGPNSEYRTGPTQDACQLTGWQSAVVTTTQRGNPSCSATKASPIFGYEVTGVAEAGPNAAAPDNVAAHFDKRGILWGESWGLRVSEAAKKGCGECSGVGSEVV
jgi:hypothetical protein